MKRMTFQKYQTTGTYNWVCPSGVTKIFIVPGNSDQLNYRFNSGVGTVLTVVPNTTYTIVIAPGQSSSYSTFGTLYSANLGSPWNGNGGQALTLMWMDG